MQVVAQRNLAMREQQQALAALHQDNASLARDLRLVSAERDSLQELAAQGQQSSGFWEHLAKRRNAQADVLEEQNKRLRSEAACLREQVGQLQDALIMERAASEAVGEIAERLRDDLAVERAAAEAVGQLAEHLRRGYSPAAATAAAAAVSAAAAIALSGDAVPTVPLAAAAPPAAAWHAAQQASRPPMAITGDEPAVPAADARNNRHVTRGLTAGMVATASPAAEPAVRVQRGAVSERAHDEQSANHTLGAGDVPAELEIEAMPPALAEANQVALMPAPVAVPAPPPLLAPEHAAQDIAPEAAAQLPVFVAPEDAVLGQVPETAEPAQAPGNAEDQAAGDVSAQLEFDPMPPVVAEADRAALPPAPVAVLPLSPLLAPEHAGQDLAQVAAAQLPVFVAPEDAAPGQVAEAAEPAQAPGDADPGAVLPAAAVHQLLGGPAADHVPAEAPGEAEAARAPVAAHGGHAVQPDAIADDPAPAAPLADFGVLAALVDIPQPADAAGAAQQLQPRAPAAPAHAELRVEGPQAAAAAGAAQQLQPIAAAAPAHAELQAEPAGLEGHQPPAAAENDAGEGEAELHLALEAPAVGGRQRRRFGWVRRGQAAVLGLARRPVEAILGGPLAVPRLTVRALYALGNVPAPGWLATAL